MRISIITVTQEGDNIAETLKNTIGGDIDMISRQDVERLFTEREAFIFIGAMGICVRTIAPLIGDKHTDPAVICVDSTGRNVISVLSGHVGGANQLTREVAAAIGAMPVITTQSDNQGLWALDTIGEDFDWKAVPNNGMNDIITTFVNRRPTALWLETRDRGTDHLEETRPETGYGYIQITDGNSVLRKVKTFIEKPNREIAEIFLKSGEFYWNSGMFLWNMQAITEALEEYLPEISVRFAEGKDFYNTDKEQEYIDTIYPTCKNISIDYGIMEKSDNVYVLMADFGWSDLGTWQSLYDLGYKDEKGNVSYKCLKKVYDASDNIIVMPEGNLAVIDGLQGYLIAQYNNVLLICRKDEEYKIRQFVADVEAMPNGKKFI